MFLVVHMSTFDLEFSRLKAEHKLNVLSNSLLSLESKYSCPRLRILLSFVHNILNLIGHRSSPYLNSTTEICVVCVL